MENTSKTKKVRTSFGRACQKARRAATIHRLSYAGLACTYCSYCMGLSVFIVALVATAFYTALAIHG